MSKNYDTSRVIQPIWPQREKRGLMELTSATDIKRPLQETLSAHVIPKLLGQTGVVPHANAFTDAQCVALAQACVSAETVDVER